MKIQSLNTNSNKNITFNGIKINELNSLQKNFIKNFKIDIQSKLINSAQDVNNKAEKIFCDIYLPDTGMIGIDESRKPFKDILNPKTNPFFKENPALSVMFFNGLDQMKFWLPVADTKIIMETMKEALTYIEKTNGKGGINFKKRYLTNLQKDVLNKYFPNQEKPTGWCEIKKFTDDPKDKISQEREVDLRKISSRTKWCTRGSFASEICLEEGNFYTYVENGKVELAVRTKKYKDGQTLSYGMKNLDLKDGDMYIVEIKNKLNEAKYKSLNDKLDELYSTSKEKFGTNIKFLSNDIKDWADW